MARLAAGVRKRANGTLEKRFTVDGVRYSVYGKTKKEIQEKETETREQIKAGLYTNNRNITLDAYFEEWLKGKRNTTKSNSLKTYSNFYKNHISPDLGGRKIQKIERREVVRLQESLLTKLSPVSCNMVLRILRTILNDAVKDDIIIKNPAAGIPKIKETEKATDTYHRALTETEQAAFMSEAESELLFEMLALMLCTGMRSGEAAALTWGDIDYKNNVIHITKTLTYTENGALIVGETPKSEAGRRDIPLTAQSKAVLIRQRDKYGVCIPFVKNNVFNSIGGGLVSNQAINRAITDTLGRLESKGVQIEHFTSHALRDTFATRYIEMGGSLQTLKTILGHSSFAMTADLYAHVMPNTKQEEMDRISAAF